MARLRLREQNAELDRTRGVPDVDVLLRRYDNISTEYEMLLTRAAINHQPGGTAFRSVPRLRSETKRCGAKGLLDASPSLLALHTIDGTVELQGHSQVHRWLPRSSWARYKRPPAKSAPGAFPYRIDLMGAGTSAANLN